MDEPTHEALDEELDRVSLRILQRRKQYQGLDFKEYQVLKTKEREIAASSKIRQISLEEVFADFERNGSLDAQLMPKAFRSYTLEDSQKAYTFGHEQDLVAYFAMGTCKNDLNLELGLISTHVPGNSGGGGWGLNGTRKLQLAQKTSVKGFNLDTFIKNSLAWVYESYDGKLHYDSRKNREERIAFFESIYRGLVG